MQPSVLVRDVALPVVEAHEKTVLNYMLTILNQGQHTQDLSYSYPIFRFFAKTVTLVKVILIALTGADQPQNNFIKL